MELRDYQKKAVEEALQDLKENKNPLVIMPAGSGKTPVIAKIAESCVDSSGRVLIIVRNERETIQMKNSLLNFTKFVRKDISVCSSGIGSECKVVVSIVQSESNSKQLKGLDKNFFGLIIVDSAHHVVSPSYQEILEHFKNVHVVGLTATPYRTDNKKLSSVFDSEPYEYTYEEAVSNGYLVPIHTQKVPLDITISDVATSSGEYDPEKLSTILNPYFEKIATTMKTYCKGRKTVVFLPLVKTAQKLQHILSKHGFRAVEVNSKTQNKEQILSDFAAGKYDVLCNAKLLTESWDCPSADCVIVLRPTKSRTLYCQMVGRGTRICEGKKDLLLLDFLGLSERYNISDSAYPTYRRNEKATKPTKHLVSKPHGSVEAEEALKKSSDDIVMKHESSLVKALSYSKSISDPDEDVDWIDNIFTEESDDFEDMSDFDEAKTAAKKNCPTFIDPFEYADIIDNLFVLMYETEYKWQSSKPTQKQLAKLVSFGICIDEIDSRGLAAELLSCLISRSKEGLATPRQVYVLHNYGFKNIDSYTYDKAYNLISKIFGNGWEIPEDIDPETY